MGPGPGPVNLGPGPVNPVVPACLPAARAMPNCSVCGLWLKSEHAVKCHKGKLHNPNSVVAGGVACTTRQFPRLFHPQLPMAQCRTSTMRVLPKCELSPNGLVTSPGGGTSPASSWLHALPSRFPNAAPAQLPGLGSASRAGCLEDLNGAWHDGGVSAPSRAACRSWVRSPCWWWTGPSSSRR